ncbi:MAG: DNA-3-methyladenine glycosylase 2 family protein [Anaerolineae bacterium]|nr:DNA-3-methyladenine glycosylase 2 family protein [Phycisphaerae bacterium]
MPTNSSWTKAQRHLSRAHPAMKRIITRVGPCKLRRRRDYFPILCHSIFAQQLSTKIANILFARFQKLFPRGRITPARVIKLLRPGANEAKLKGVGLSRQKRACLLDLARHFERGEIPTRKFARMGDEEIIETLTKVNGIGRWTAEMFLIFVLNRPDLWPVDDLGLREGIKRLNKLPDRPKPKDCIANGDCFRPYRSIATWYLWRSLSLNSQS